MVSAGFHALNSALVFLFLLLATQAKWRSAVVAVLFAVYPLHVESVAWASERKDVLSALFGLITLIAYTNYAHAKDANRASASRTSRESSFRPSPWFWYGLAVVALALGLMSKPMLVTWPFVLLLIDFWPLQRIGLCVKTRPDKAASRLGKTPTIRKASLLVLEKIPFFALSIASSIITYKVQRHGGAVSFTLTTYERLANAVVAYARYLIKGFWPAKLSVLYPHPGDWPAPYVIGSVLLMLAVTVLALALWRHRPYVITGWLLFLGTMIPTIGLVQVGVQSMADPVTLFALPRNLHHRCLGITRFVSTL